MITIIDYGLGNIRSLINWFNREEMQVVLSRDPEVIKASDLLILPGVGAYEDAMKMLNSYGLDELIIEEASSGKPLVGICLGMQLLYEGSYEGSSKESYTDGLGLIKGEIKSFDSSKIKVPHMGWNNLVSNNSSLNDLYVYFVHSYYADSNNEELIAYADYDVKVPGVVKQKNILGFQFHPEKSGDSGEAMMDMIKELQSDYISSN